MPAGDNHSSKQSNRSWMRDLVVVACAISAGIHAALTPEHLAEGTAPGLAFAASAVALAGLCVALTVHPGVVPLVAASVLLAGLVAAYGLAVTSGLPVLHKEPAEALAVVTKAVELLGLAAALHLVLRGRELPVAVRPRPKGTFA